MSALEVRDAVVWTIVILAMIAVPVVLKWSKKKGEAEDG